MPTLRIEHAVADFGGWKQAFDNDPVGREKSGVRSYRVLRPINDPNWVMIDLEFDTTSEAEALLDAMRAVWAGPARTIVSDPQARIAEHVETREYVNSTHPSRRDEGGTPDQHNEGRET